jgi:transposase-like protein
LLPDAPVPDGRTVLTSPDASSLEAVRGHERHPPLFIRDTNSVESLHMQIRKTIKTRGHFPNDDAALRLIWLAIMRAKTTWRTCYKWTQAMAVLRIHFGDRIPDNT